MSPEFVVVETAEEFDRYIKKRNRLIFSIILGVISSFFFSSFFVPFFPLSDIVYIFLGFLVLFIYGDYTKNLKHRSYIKATFAFLYGFWGIAFIVVGIFMYIQKPDTSTIIISSVIGIAFLYLSYRYLKKYTTLIDRITYHIKHS